MKIRKAKLDKLFHYPKNPIAKGRNPRGFGTFIEGVDYEGRLGVHRGV
jgi:hypothetical protein